ncbi:hypothetical protein MMC28_011098 [Mycoblastus sanguinarius]|nr:hypothetical protein [Mycoblastus sanguinarius]
MLIFPSLLLFISLASAASGQGSVSLWSDSECGQFDDQFDATTFGERDPVALNYTLPIDTCGTPGAAAHSYQLTQVPSCANGTEASFNFYNGENCQAQGFGPALNSIDTDPSEFVGVCLALVEFRSVAFVCKGIGQGGGQQGSSSTSTLASSSTAPTSTVASLPSTLTSSSSATSTSNLASSSGTLAPTTTPLASATPIAPSAKVTSPIYTTSVGNKPLGSLPAGTAPFGTNPSGGLPSPSGSAIKPSPSSFTGAASEVGRSGFEVLVALMVAFML